MTNQMCFLLWSDVINVWRLIVFAPFLIIIPPANKVWGGYIGITLSVRPCTLYLVSTTKRLIGFL